MSVPGVVVLGVRSPEPARRTGYGSLAGQLVMSDDWDSDEVNEAIARDFGMTDS